MRNLVLKWLDRVAEIRFPRATGYNVLQKNLVSERSTARVLGFGAGAESLVHAWCVKFPCITATVVLPAVDRQNRDNPVVFPEIRNKVTIHRLAFTEFRESPVFDLFLLGNEFLWETETSALQILSYGRMLLRPGGVCLVQLDKNQVNSVAKSGKNKEISAKINSLGTLLRQTGYHPVRPWAESAFRPSIGVLARRPLVSY